MLKIMLALAATAAASSASAADAANGRRIAQNVCAACHAIASPARSEVGPTRRRSR